ncbi:PREDICTED: putative F-box protein At1g12190 [Camelina sativa]|uniref:F-box protein At1g12190 n=1 Tax=Camelina sativa TaxID=90675 RepID=A0ABM1R5V5_CAMSA|nr:PREDICTED: putative F-box protein At1g12190 [Camelina sativa]
MAHVNLPEELVEEILHRCPSLSLSRFRTVSKEWNTLFNDTTFIHKHLALIRTQFLLWTNSKVYSVGLNLNDNDPKVELRELALNIPDLSYHRTTNFLPCNDLLFCASWWWNNKAVVWNPSLRQTRCIKSEEEHFRFGGIGYDSGNPGKGYHIFGYSYRRRSFNGTNSMFYKRFSMYNFGSNAWKCINDVSEEETFIEGSDSLDNNVSLNGNLYWAASDFTVDKYVIQSFDFSKEILKIFCVLPWKKKYSDIPVLSVFRGDRLSVLNKFKGTNDIEIWVTKNKINEDVENVVWMMFMTISIPIYKGSSPSYFINDIYEKRLVMCCSDESGKGCIYIVSGHARKKIQIDFDVSEFSHCFYDPSLIPIPCEGSDQETDNN